MGEQKKKGVMIGAGRATKKVGKKKLFFLVDSTQ